MSEKKYARQDRWVKENTVRLIAKINKHSEADILTILERVPNKQGFIKDAIRYYIAHGCPPTEVPTEEEINFALKRIVADSLVK